MNHQFDVEQAILFGLQEAIFINNFHFWLRQNAANERSIRNGKPWTYNTHKAYVKQFPYMTENQIRRVLESLVSLNVLEKAKFSENKYDHTLWYSFTDEYLASNPLFDMAKKPDRNVVKPASHTDKNTDTSSDGLFDAFWKAYPKKVGKDAAKKAFDKRKPDVKLLDDMLRAVAQQKQAPGWIKDDGQFVPNPATWLNQGRWMDGEGEAGQAAQGGIAAFPGAI